MFKKFGDFIHNTPYGNDPIGDLRVLLLVAVSIPTHVIKLAETVRPPKSGAPSNAKSTWRWATVPGDGRKHRARYQGAQQRSGAPWKWSARWRNCQRSAARSTTSSEASEECESGPLNAQHRHEAVIEAAAAYRKPCS